MRAYVGTSGWVYADWRGRFYPDDLPQSRWLGAYARSFATVELNNSFYRLPSEDAFKTWRASVPEGFVFAVKASRFITHLKRLREGKEPNALLLERARGLGPRLGPVLYQMPPRFPVDVERLAAFLPTVPTRFQAAFEFRDPSWAIDEVFALLEQHGAAWVLADTPGARIPDVVTGGWSYVRFHRGRFVTPKYAMAKLRRWADRVAALDAREVYLYFNNDQGAAAPKDALAMVSLLEQRGVAVAQPAAAA